MTTSLSILKHLDYRDADLSPDCRFSAHIPSTEAMNSLMDESKLAVRVCGGVHCRELTISSSCKVPEQRLPSGSGCLKSAVDLLLQSAVSFNVVTIHFDSKTAILASI